MNRRPNPSRNNLNSRNPRGKNRPVKIPSGVASNQPGKTRLVVRIRLVAVTNQLGKIRLVARIRLAGVAITRRHLILVLLKTRLNKIAYCESILAVTVFFWPLPR